MIVLRVLPWFDNNLQMIMNPHRTARHRYEIVIGGLLGSDTVGGVVSGGVLSYLIYYAA